MKENINILILSCGTRNKIVQYFKKELGDKGKVFATDSSELAPALYDADEYFIVPRISDPGYLDYILNICKENNITGILSLIDPELSLLAKNRQKFIDIGTTPIVSDYEVVEKSFDKHIFNQFLEENSFNSMKCYIDINEFYIDLEKEVINFPVFVKPYNGSASININKVNSKDELDLLFSKFDNLMIQEYMDGTEYGVDVYIDMISNELVSIFIKEKIKMRAGETDKSVSVKDSELLELVKDFVETSGYRGIIDIDIFKVDSEYYISEVNPRFGGGYPHAYESGVNIPEQIITNLKKEENRLQLNEYEENIYMMKYNELRIEKLQTSGES